MQNKHTDSMKLTRLLMTSVKRTVNKKKTTLCAIKSFINISPMDFTFNLKTVSYRKYLLKEFMS